jgi:hypothetical protein
MLKGKSRDMGLGPFPDVTLAEAREKAATARRLLRDGRDPLEEKRASEAAQNDARARTFRLAAEGLIAQDGGTPRTVRSGRRRWRPTSTR